jgi:diaminopimelate epimerase
MNLKFTKMHGLGNDFVVIDDRTARLSKLAQMSKKLCDRRFGIGADQLLLLQRSRRADFKMRIFNADGSEVEMCGNGIRCLAKYIWDNKLTARNRNGKTLTVETPAGIIVPKRSGDMIEVDMGEPLLDGKEIPVNIKGTVIDHPFKLNKTGVKITCVSMGNPHTVIVVKDVRSVPLALWGPEIETNALFPERTNVEFIQAINSRNIKMRVWERGAGETMACGTGAAAAGVASVLLGLTKRKVTVHLPGGRLLIEWSAEDNHVYMTGPGEKVYEGLIEI